MMMIYLLMSNHDFIQKDALDMEREEYARWHRYLILVWIFIETSYRILNAIIMRKIPIAW